MHKEGGVMAKKKEIGEKCLQLPGAGRGDEEIIPYIQK